MAFYSNSYDGRQLRLEVWQSGEYVYWQLFSEGGNTQYYTIYNLSISINGVSVYAPGTVSWNSYVFPAAKGNVSGNVYVGGSAGNRTIYVSFVGAVYYNRTTQNGGNFTMGPTIYAPGLSNISVGSISDTSVYASFSVTNNNGQAPYSPYIDVATSNFSGVVKTIQARAGTLSGLTPNRTYYVRGNDANDGGRSYTNVTSFKTSFVNPGNPGKPALTYDQTEVIPRAKVTAAWSAASAGSTAVAGYRIRLFKNNVEVFNVDTENTNLSYTFNSLESYGFLVGDKVKVGIYSYSKDWEGTKFFNGGGAASSQIYSNELTVVSDKYIYASVNGAAFNKYKMYISVNGGSFTEVKKEKFKVIK